MKVTIGKFARLVFVVFSLYLLGDVFYRWDGFSYHSSFMEFLPSVALVVIIWTIVALLTTALIWLPFSLIEALSNRIGLKIKIEHLLVYTCVLIIWGLLVWEGKKLLFPYVQTTYLIKLIVFLFVHLLAVITAWLVRDRAGHWTEAVLDRTESPCQIAYWYQGASY